MRRILEELYHGNLSVNEQAVRRGSEYARAQAEVARLEDALGKNLPSEAHALLQEYALACGKLSSISNAENFILGFRMGAQFMMAVLLPDEQLPELIGSKCRDE